jgi:hypothetical protein
MEGKWRRLSEAELAEYEAAHPITLKLTTSDMRELATRLEKLSEEEKASAERMTTILWYNVALEKSEMFGQVAGQLRLEADRIEQEIEARYTMGSEKTDDGD